MNAFIEQNKRLLKFYDISARIIGGLILIKVGIDVVLVLVGYSRASSNIALSMVLINSVFLGFIALGVGRFIRYSYDLECRAGWMLRHGGIILYLYAGFQFIFKTRSIYYYCVVAMARNVGPYYSPWKSFFENVIPVIAMTFIIFGLGQIFRRIMPVIEESKTLV